MSSLLAWILLARLLEPSDFGLVALAMVVFSTIHLFASLGMDEALVYTKLDKSRVAFPAFCVTVLTSIVAFCVVFFNADFWARLLGDPDVEQIVRALSALMPLVALRMVPEALLRKELRFGTLSLATLVGQLVDNGLALVLAFAGFGVWSLVLGKLSSSVTKLFVTWFGCPGWDWLIPRRWKWAELRGLFRFGLQNTGGGIIAFFNQNWDDWLVGRMLGATALGYYSKAFNFTTKTVEDFGRNAIGVVLFPTYARLQDDRTRLSRAYTKSFGVVALLMIPIAMGIFVTAPEVVSVLLGEKWLPMVPALQVFAFKTLARPLSLVTAPLFQGVGRPDLNVRAGLVVTGVMVPLALLLLGRGFVGVAVAVTVAHVAGLSVNIFLANRFLSGTASKTFQATLPSLVAGAIMVLVVQFSKIPLLRLTDGQFNLFSLAAMISVGVVVYTLLAFLLQRALVVETIGLALSAVRSRRQVAVGGY